MSYLARLFFSLSLSLSLSFLGSQAHAADLPPPMAALAAKVAPAVVSITALSPTGTGDMASLGNDGGNKNNGTSNAASNGLPPEGAPKADGLIIPPPQTVEALGSGFIFEPSGYILTNNHVVQGATDVTVTLSNDMVYPAIIIGYDPKADLAVLKISTGAPLPFLQFGDSNQMKVGDWVLAVGNPYGMSNTNTAGIVSALHRQIGDTQFDDFIQTDAAINKGNSGGPLLNMQGQVIGVNSAIYAPAGTSDGIGFSIPSAMAGPVADALVRNGKMTRGWLGVSTEEISPDIQKAFRLSQASGALVGAVAGNGPAAGKLQPGDIITSLGGAAIDNPRALFIRVAEIQAGETVPVDYIRNGVAAQAQLIVTVPPSTKDETIELDQTVTVKPLMLPGYGLGLSGNGSAAGVEIVAATGPAAKVGLMKGDVISQVNGAFVNNAEELARQLKTLGDNPALLFVTGPMAGKATTLARWVALAPESKKT